MGEVVTVNLPERIEKAREKLAKLNRTAIEASTNAESHIGTTSYYPLLAIESHAWIDSGDAARELLQLLTGRTS